MLADGKPLYFGIESAFWSAISYYNIKSDFLLNDLLNSKYT